MCLTSDEIPSDLDSLPKISGKMNDVNDAWGRPILFQRDGDEVTLSSLGRDGKLGGTGADREITGVFSVKIEAFPGNPEDQWIERPR